MRRLAYYLIIVALLAMTSCAAGSVVTTDADLVTHPTGQVSCNSHQFWGLWQFVADPEAMTLDIIQLRSADFHLNALPFLEPPPLVNLTLESLKFTGNIVDADIGLRHPFLGLTEFTGFDVCGIFISNGSVTGFDDSSLRMAGTGDTRLLNPDGYSRWWNPVEFPHGNTMLGYKDGLLGTPDSAAHYNSTLNAYKYFTDGLGPNDSVDKANYLKRGVFSAGQKNIRHYKIDMSAGLIFNYAVDASWKFPNGSPPWSVPDDFPPDANRAEAWNVKINETVNTLWNDGSSSGGNLSLSIDVWDHFNAGLNSIRVESPGNFSLIQATSPIGGGPGYSTYEIDVTSATPAMAEIRLLISVISEEADFEGFIPGKYTTAYFIHTAKVASEKLLKVISPNGGEEWKGLTHKDITWSAPVSIEYVDLYYSKDDFVGDINLIVADYKNTGVYDWYIPNDPSTTVKVKVVQSGGTLEDTSDNYFTILKGICDFGPTGFTLAGTYSLTQRWTYMGVKVTHQDPIQRLILQGLSTLNNTLFIHNASNPTGSAVASYNTGDLIYCNNNRAFWVDPISVPGIDRIIYNNYGGGSPTDGYQLKTIDWDGTQFINPQVLPKHTISQYQSLWNLCVTPEGNLILHNANTLTPTFMKRDKSNGYQITILFTLQQSTCPFGQVSYIKDIAYDWMLDAVILFCRNEAVSNGGQVFVLDMTGKLLYQDLDVFGGTLISYNASVDVDIKNPACRIIVYAGEDAQSGKYWIGRYSWDFTEKSVKQYTGLTYGPARGELCADGTLWAAWENSAGVHKFNKPPDW